MIEITQFEFETEVSKILNEFKKNINYFKMYTIFIDMYSGGFRKEDYDVIIIEAPEKKATQIFIDTFGHRPDDVECDCCGDNYMVYETSNIPEYENVLVLKGR